MFNKLVTFFRARVWLHIAGSFLSAEIVYTILRLCGLGFESMFFASLTPILVGVISEIKDMIYENKYPKKTQKHIADIMSWVMGSGFYLACKYLQYMMLLKYQHNVCSYE